MATKILKENSNEEYHKNIINRLQKEIDIKSNQLDEEKKKSLQIKSYYEQLYKKKLLNDEEAKLASTVYVPERLIINKEKSELYVKIEKLRKENRKINDEKKKLNREKEELKKKMEDLESELKSQKEKNTKGIQIQSKETNSLRKEREKLKKQNNELKEEIKLLNQKISTLEHQLLNQPRGGSGIRRKSSRKVDNKQSQSLPIPKKDQNGYVAMDIYERIQKQENEALPIINANVNRGDKLLSELVYFCMAKKIDIKHHLRGYDTAKNGRLNDDIFMKAIRELNTSFTDNDISELIKRSKPKDGGDILIDEFVELLKSKDYNYKVKEDTIVSANNKQASSKYDLFENKPYNLDYQ